MRFLLSRRWVLFALTVALAAYGAVLLGRWQFHRLDERRASNTLVAKNLDLPPVPLDQVMAPGRDVRHDDQWRRVVVTGTWDDAHTIVLKYQTREGAAGVEVVTPLVTAARTAVLVDRGWLSTENSGGTRPKTPATTAGEVTVIGWARQNATGGATAVDDLSTRAISSTAAARVLPYPLYGGFLDLHVESPAPATALGAIELPDDNSEGPHFFYGLQWWFFGALAIFGFGYLAYDERKLLLAERAKASEGTDDEPDDDPDDA